MPAGLIFFSWQDDRPPHVGRLFVRSMLNEVLGFAGRDHAVLEASRDGYDATRISQSVACVIDLTAVPSQANGGIPNPDGLIDLGNALSSLGWERVVCLVNTAFGFSNLTLDTTRTLGHLILFDLTADCDLKARLSVRHRVVSALSRALRPTLSHLFFDQRPF